MTVIKGMKKILGAELTSDERKAMRIEIGKQLAEDTRNHTAELDACVLWFLHTEFGFGKKRLRKAHDKFAESIDALCNRYEMCGTGDDAWLCTRMLSEYGVDVKAWNDEKEKEGD